MKYFILVLFLSVNLSASELWVTTSLYTYHYDREWAWNENQQLVGLEYQDNQWFGGLSAFKNSFGGDSQALYGGYQWGDDYGVRLAGGLARGYKKEYCPPKTYTYERTSTFFFSYEERWDQPACMKTEWMIGEYRIVALLSAYKEVGRFKAEIAALGKDAVMVMASFKL